MGLFGKKKTEEVKKEETKIDEVKAAGVEVELIETDEVETDEELNRLESCGMHSYHISKVKDGQGDQKWRVRRSCTDKTIKFFHTQLEAIKYAKVIAKEQNLPITIHKVDGKTRTQDYAKDKK